MIARAVICMDRDKRRDTYTGAYNYPDIRRDVGHIVLVTRHRECEIDGRGAKYLSVVANTAFAVSFSSKSGGAKCGCAMSLVVFHRSLSVRNAATQCCSYSHVDYDTGAVGPTNRVICLTHKTDPNRRQGRCRQPLCLADTLQTSRFELGICTSSKSTVRSKIWCKFRHLVRKNNRIRKIQQLGETDPHLWNLQKRQAASVDGLQRIGDDCLAEFTMLCRKTHPWMRNARPAGGIGASRKLVVSTASTATMDITPGDA